MRLRRGQEIPFPSGNRYEIRRWEGEGSYAAIYQAVRVGSGEACALKLPKREVPEAVARAGAEGEVLARVRDPAVVRLLDRGEWEGLPLLALEWLPGDALSDALRRRPRFPLRQALEILEHVCAGLAAFHAAGVVHGDIRPQNVLLMRERGAVLIDPGGEGAAAADLVAAGAAAYRLLCGVDHRPGVSPPAAEAGYHRSAGACCDRLLTAGISAREAAAEFRRLQETL
jgi:eukaryotic-like serine/threonine-protein kinase